MIISTDIWYRKSIEIITQFSSDLYQNRRLQILQSRKAMETLGISFSLFALVILINKDLCEAGVIRYMNEGSASNATKLWVMNLVKTPGIWFKGKFVKKHISL